MNEYITALTIGPIYKTIQRAEQTRELWGASMLFSLLMRIIVEEITNNKSIEVIVPYFDASVVDAKQANHIGTGLLPDRLIFKSKNDNGKELLDAAIQNAFSRLTDLFPEVGKNRDGIRAFFSNYLKCYFVQKKYDSSKGNAIKQVSDFLNTLELQQLPAMGINILDKYLDRVPSIDSLKKYFPEDKKGFDTIPEIALQEFEQHNKYKDFIDDLISKRTKNGRYRLKEDVDVIEVARGYFNGEYILTPHQYICIIHADGDGIGSLLTGITDNDVKKISSGLFSFGVKAQSMINDYGAMPIYIGGDDLFFFAPFRNRRQKAAPQNVFELCRNLDVLFKEEIKNCYNIERKDISLSFGLGITYYKYPMGEAIELSRGLMFAKAKSNKFTLIVGNSGSRSKVKNNLAFSARQHSGATWGGVFQLDEDRRHMFDATLALMTAELSDNKGKLLKSVIHKISINKFLLMNLLTSKEPQHRLRNFFDNNFDEEEHRAYRSEQLFERIIEILSASYKTSVDLKAKGIGSEEWEVNETELFAIENTLGALRLVKFINQKDEHE